MYTCIGCVGFAELKISKNFVLKDEAKIHEELLQLTNTAVRDSAVTGPYAYDALWAIAVALNTTDSRLKAQQPDYTSLANFSYRNGAMGRIIFEEMSAVRIDGATVC